MQYASGADRSDDVGIADGGGRDAWRDAQAGGIDDVFARLGGTGGARRGVGGVTPLP